MNSRRTQVCATTAQYTFLTKELQITGNKMDKATRRVITQEEANKLVEENFAPWFQAEVQEEYASSVNQHGNFNSLHEAYGVMLEEFDELWDEIKKKTKDRDTDNLHKEIVQIAAMCQKLDFDLRFGFGKRVK